MNYHIVVLDSLKLVSLDNKAQTGNPKVRLFRLKEDHGIINRMGFNNEGVEMAIHHLKKARKNGVLVGGNIGKNKVTPNEKQWMIISFASKVYSTM